MSVTHSEFTIERRLAHAPARAFSGFAHPDLKRRWFANPGGWDEWHHELDFRVGGHEVNRGGDHGQKQRLFEARFHDIVQDERIVFAYDLHHDDRLLSVSLTTIEFHPDGDGTLLAFTEQGAFFDDLDAPGEREHGTGKLLDAYQRFLDGEER
jgi:uncharacterized protein YndB with AHSA1/START domain